MGKRQILILLALTAFCAGSLPAAEIKSVVRDYYYPNIFMYKTHLVGKPKANQFAFEEEVDKKPEYFRVFVKASEEDLGRTVDVVFQYKPHKQGDFKERRERLTLSKRTEAVTFMFSKPEIEAEGYVEQWAVRILKDDEIVAEQKSSGNADMRETPVAKEKTKSGKKI